MVIDTKRKEVARKIVKKRETSNEKPVSNLCFKEGWLNREIFIHELSP